MGLDLRYKAQGTVWEKRLSQSDWSTVEALRSHLPHEIAICFDVPDLGQDVQISTASLQVCATTICNFLDAHAELLPATYQFRTERFPIAGVPPIGFGRAGGIGGIQLPGDGDHFYQLRAGLDECSLTKLAIGVDGRGLVVDRRDLRSESDLLTANYGRIEFRRRAAKSTLLRTLFAIATFATEAKGGHVTKVAG